MKFFKLFLFTTVVLINLSALFSQDTVGAYFNINCKACHTIGGGRLIGPDLLGIEDRADREWLIHWIVDPTAVLASGDAYAQKILKESNNVSMVKSPGITADLAASILDYIQTRTDAGELDQAYVEPVFTKDDVVAGRGFFNGKTKLSNGGAPCIACHTVNSLTGLGGGKLGVNLTDAYDRLGNTRGLSTWLKAPPTETMLPVFLNHPFTDDEITGLVAFLKNEFEISRDLVFAASANLLLYGFLGAILLFLLIGAIWSHRFRSVRKTMIKETVLD